MSKEQQKDLCDYFKKKLIAPDEAALIMARVLVVIERVGFQEFLDNINLGVE